MKNIFKMIGRALVVGAVFVGLTVALIQPVAAQVLHAPIVAVQLLQGGTAVVVDPVVTAFVTGFVSFLLTQGVKALVAMTGVDLTGFLAAAVAFVVNIIIDQVNGLLALQSADASTVIVKILVLLVSLASMYGIHYTYRGLKNPSPPKAFGLPGTLPVKK